MRQTLFPPNVYWFLFGLLGIVYGAGLFVPLMDNDSAHHANIALRMYLTGDYVSLIDNGKDYLDKPHLHFWLAAASYHVFGVTTFAYKFPSFLFTIVGTYSTFRLGKSLYNAEAGKLAALMAASAFAYILANNDVRMDAILTACIIFSTWHLVDWVNNKRLINVFGAALGLALGFGTKGHIAVFTPAVSALFYILYKKEWKLFFHWHLLLLIASFFVFIMPVVYCYYLQYDLHPEKIIRGRSNRSGVAFILWNQNIERFEGESFGSDAKNDYLFFIHSFLWAFAPWSLLAFVVFVKRIASFKMQKHEWLTAGTFAVMFLIITLSSFKLPHYLNIIFPIAAVMTASWILEVAAKDIRWVWITQLIISMLLLLIGLALNFWAFPVHSFWLLAVAILMMVVAFYLLFTSKLSSMQRSVAGPAAIMIAIFFLLNTNFYPQLLRHQAGNELAKTVNREIGGNNIYFWEGTYSSSLSYYTKTLRRPFSDSVLARSKNVWIAADESALTQIENMYATGRKIGHVDYEITQLQLDFVNPATRREALGRMWLIEILGKK